ncbi:hypothetical protein BN7_2905 [Wickerhamomyces ciferrii]|uniref:Uncharacterized protein n=1 Tax=Wickerhamomyces ciferrii (strain ATCC 14091 / BCRC 22168 / CBS 111 / JCM 3599 / NBRC 0793 / NRRL Y-1031 F-60-10) TaxID=1206466 RepID=K0KMD5_WICCF|nr:uncharacterized protein BN7_2905 [Wickerhamomyces ciferrii]CCH43357.1 hypothetical protein BN7_2905 [Wickerhamomyces ciferrii]
MPPPQSRITSGTSLEGLLRPSVPEDLEYVSPSSLTKNERPSDIKRQQILLNTLENKDYMIIQALYRKDNHMILDNTKDEDPNNTINMKSIGDSFDKNQSIARARHRMLMKIAGRETE